MVDFREPEKLIGSNTVGSITSGLYYGFIGMIDGIVERVIAELGPDTKAIATGGQGSLIVAGIAAGENLRRGPDAGRTATDLGRNK